MLQMDDFGSVTAATAQHELPDEQKQRRGRRRRRNSRQLELHRSALEMLEASKAWLDEQQQQQREQKPQEEEEEDKKKATPKKLLETYLFGGHDEHEDADVDPFDQKQLECKKTPVRLS